MNLDKHHAVLERIFEFLLANGRKDLVDEYNNTSHSEEKGKVCKAKRQWRCCKCRKTIKIGEKYFCISIAMGGTWISKRFCLNCQNRSHEQKTTQSKFKFIAKD